MLKLIHGFIILIRIVLNFSGCKFGSFISMTKISKLRPNTKKDGQKFGQGYE